MKLGKWLFNKIKPFLRIAARQVYLVLNLLYYPFLKLYFCKKIQQVPSGTQVFLMTRLDFGTFPILLHYARCWQEVRGPACVVVLTSRSHIVQRMAKLICPEVSLISADHPSVRWIPYIFGRWAVQFATYNPLYCHIASRWPQALYIFDQGIDIEMKESVSDYISCFDENLQNVSKYSPDFIKAYRNVREVMDYRPHVYQDWVELHYETNLRLLWPDDSFIFDALKICRKYVVMNINSKDYNHSLQNIKRVFHPERYNALIDFLIENGYQVVIQGRLEQPMFKEREGLIDYSKTAYCSVENDLKLYSRCEFAILNKSGPELLATVCNVPILGLNSVEHCAMQPNPRYRFYPKPIWSRRLGRFLSWKEVLSDPCFFDLGKRGYNRDIEYQDMQEQDLIRACEEFIGLLPRTFSEWSDYTSNQVEFKNFITPFHLDLFRIKGVPCEAYLSRLSE